MIAALLRALAFHLRTSSGVDYHPPRQPVVCPWRWRCSCGGKSRGAWPIQYDAESAAMQHWLRQAVPHPRPEIYATDGTPTAPLTLFR